MAKEIALIDTEELKTISVPIRALDAYNFALNATCKEMDEGEVANFIATRNLKAMGFVELNETKKRLQSLVDSIDEVTKHAFNVGDWDDLPDEKGGPSIKWSKQSYTYGWTEGAARFVAQKMIESNLCTAEQLFDQVTVTGLCKACGITTEKLLSMFDGAVEEKPKARTLIIKG
jgi:hypothetical protein